MHDELEQIAQTARSMMETDSPQLASGVAIGGELYGEHVEAGVSPAERVDAFTRGAWRAQTRSVLTLRQLASWWREMKIEEAMVALGYVETVTTDVDAIRNLAVDVGVVANSVFMRESRRRDAATKVHA